ncbi:hypothetical protein [Paenibacillus silvae]|uniref:hypothetical protein n=1 Tax=Paenibacillus silvae TaxID=1325358 RepID=UPI0020039DE2|nr:hypothetical protein [Paenibacillus silvae]MCK6076723.1 hypothetical protein [Paenibacillus silvae]MCK6151150.1 hypothetical protein [Paenibacillus silvae]MCK6269409.1 hypothetical protein [Paenibacillus silvae]
MNHKLAKGIERLSAISVQSNTHSHQKSHHVLIKEYLRRVNVFLDKLNVFPDRYPLFSFAKLIGRKIDANVYRACPELDTLNNSYMKAICYSYLEVCELIDQGVDDAIQYADLYDPMLKFFERGGSFTIRKGELVLGDAAYPLMYWRTLVIPVQDISDIFLDLIDRYALEG